MRAVCQQWRLLATGFSFLVFGIGAFVLGLVLVTLVSPWPVAERRKNRWTRLAIRSFARLYIRMMWLLGLLTFTFRNSSGFRGRGELVVANHPSLLDAVFLLAVLPAPCCIVKGALARNPLTSAVIRLAGYIPNDGDGELLMSGAAKVIARGETLVIFPEGTRTQRPAELKLRRGAANIALAARCRIRPVIIQVCPPTLRKHEPWYQVPETRPCFTLEALDTIAVAEQVDAERSAGVQARQLTRHLQTVFQERLQVA